MVDMVNEPPHYKSGGMEAIDVIEAFFADDFHLASAFKYLARAGKKGDYVEDLEKAAWYLQREISRHGGTDKRLDRAATEASGMPIIPSNPGRVQQ